MLTDYHAKYFAYELTRQAAGDDIDRISTSLFDASVVGLPHTRGRADVVAGC